MLLEFEELPYSDWLDEETYSNGICIDYANEGTNPRLAKRKDLVLIRTLEHIICYDLNQKQQVDYLLHMSQLTTENYESCDNGFIFPQLS